MGDRTTIQISTALRERLKAQGKKGESYEQIIERLLNEKDGENERNKLSRR